MKDKIYCGILNLYYGSMLTEHQREILRLYYDCDMSLAEISDSLGVTRQAIRENIERATNKLYAWETKLGVVRKVNSIKEKLERIISDFDVKEKSEIKDELNNILTEIKEL